MPHSILVVDDESAIRSAIRRKLEKDGYHVHEAGDGNEAIKALESASFDLVLTDIIMPEKDGLETICFVRKHQPAVKVIAISSPTNELFLESAVGLGASCILEKPLVLEELAATVERLLRQRDAEAKAKLS